MFFYYWNEVKPLHKCTEVPADGETSLNASWELAFPLTEMVYTKEYKLKSCQKEQIMAERPSFCQMNGYCTKGVKNTEYIQWKPY